MPKTLEQVIKFNAPPEKVYKLYMDPEKHAEVTGHAVSIGKQMGDKFKAFDGHIEGRMLHVVERKMIVQTWRGSEWKKKDQDSILMLTFQKVFGGTKLHLVHAGIPNGQLSLIKKGWDVFYWKAWKAYLKGK